MQKFTGVEYTKIAVANAFGLDKELWDNRITWFNMNEDHIEKSLDQADEPMLARKAWKAYKDAKAGIPTGFIMGLDATASGLQIMACLSGCKKTAENVNLIDTGKRADIYSKVANLMNSQYGCNVDRATVKHPIMTTFYGSIKQPQEVFGKDTPELAAFYAALNTELPGAMEVMNDIQVFWDGTAMDHNWTLPDGHRAIVKVMEAVDKKIEVDELNHATFTHRAYVNKPVKKGLSLAANVIHSIDGWVVREMIRRSHKLHFQIATIHDSFWCHPNHMNKLRKLYVEILAEICEMPLLENIMKEIVGKAVIHPYNKKISNLVLNSEYALS